VQVAGPVGQQRPDWSSALPGAVGVEDDPGEPAGEPPRVLEPVESHEGGQERFLHHVLGGIRVAAQAPSAGERRGSVPLDQQSEGNRVTRKCQAYEVTVIQLHTRKCQRRPGWSLRAAYESIRLADADRIAGGQHPGRRGTWSLGWPMGSTTWLRLMR